MHRNYIRTYVYHLYTVLKMGIPRFTRFIEENFHGWQLKEIEGYLVIDGYSLCHDLYNSSGLDWAQGGQYPEYQEAIIHFLQTLMKSGIKPIVVFDGIDYKQEKTSTIVRRRKENIRYVHNRLSESKLFECHGGVLPVLASKVFKQAIAGLGIPLVVVDGEADVAIFQLANHYSCPVLAADSDYYMFNLKGGYIPTKNLNVNAFPITAKVFHIQAFTEQFKYPDLTLRVIIPAIVGNDFLCSLQSSKFNAHIKEVVSLDSSQCHSLLPVVHYAGRFKSLDEFFSRISSIEGLPCKKWLLSNCIKSREMYDSDITQSLDQLKASETTELRKKSGEAIPEWLIKQFRDDHLSSFVLECLVLGNCIPRIAVDDTKADSVHVISQRLRQYSYGLLGLESVTEYLRQGLELVGVRVAAIDSLNGQLLPSLEEVSRLSDGERKEMLYLMLGCDPSDLEKLPEEWRLVTASVIYWTVFSHVPRRLVKALLLCLLLCSSKSCDLSEIRRSFRIPHVFRHSPKWIGTVYAFSQWQCCFHASCSLSEVLMEPLRCISPAFLYDGRIAVYFSIYEHMNLPRSIDMTLYKCLFDTVAAHTEPRKLVSKPSAKHQKAETGSRAQKKTGGPKKPALMHTYAPSIQLKNRFACLEEDQ